MNNCLGGLFSVCVCLLTTCNLFTRDNNSSTVTNYIKFREQTSVVTVSEQTLHKPYYEIREQMLNILKKLGTSFSLSTGMTFVLPTTDTAERVLRLRLCKKCISYLLTRNYTNNSTAVCLVFYV